MISSLIALAGAAGLLLGLRLGMRRGREQARSASEASAVQSLVFYDREAEWQRIQDRIVVNELVGYDTAEEA